ncbi:isochorismate synthase [Roseomonas sp. KE0001]|nr:isochorismate synthase [Roseomonas sp. KE0001]
MPEADGRTAGPVPAPEPPPLAFLSGESSLLGWGCRRRLPPGGADSLGERVARFFAAAPDGPAVVAGALPFDRAAPDHLLQPDRLERGGRVAGLATPAPAASGGAWRLVPRPSAAAYADAVRQALARMAAETGRPETLTEGALTKIVLSRGLLARSEGPIDTVALLDRLAADPAVTGFRLPLPAGTGGAPRWLMGATPELLLRKRGGAILSHPLAGSARRHADAAADRAAGEALLRSEKDRREHRIVSDYILDTLSPWCRRLAAPDGITLSRTRTLWHLGTRIEGELRDQAVLSATLAAALHPTPAVCGQPRARAAALIREIEPEDRGFYAGAVGWCDASGDGDWFVTIRCAEIAGDTARLYAGAGIVPGSSPEGEADETAAKFGALLDALGAGDAARECPP